MSEKIKQDIINTMLYARRDWDRLLEQVDEVKMLQPGTCGKWSVKDIIAHVTWFEREMVELFKTRKLEGSPLWELEVDKRNEEIFQHNQFRALDEVREESLRVFAHLLSAIEELEPEELVDPQRIEGMPAEWKPYEILADNTWNHYATHSRHVQAMLNR